MIGRECCHRWLAVLLVASLGRRGDVSRELALTAIDARRDVRAGRDAAVGRRRHAGSAFIVGLLSLLDVLLEIPMESPRTASSSAQK